MIFKEELINNFNYFKIKLNDKQIAQFEKYYKLILEWNEKMNLTAITTEKEFVIKHLVDSVLKNDCFKQNASVVDVGCGAGFPSIPLKILRPDLKITMVDSLNKRITFLNETISQLGLKDICAIHSRAEDFAVANREKFDYSTARAVAKLNTLTELCLPVVKIGGSFVAYKTNDNEEVLQAQNAIKILGGKISNIVKYDLGDFGERNLVVIEKIHATQTKYPRGKNLPKTNPL